MKAAGMQGLRKRKNLSNLGLKKGESRVRLLKRNLFKTLRNIIWMSMRKSGNILSFNSLLIKSVFKNKD